MTGSKLYAPLVNKSLSITISDPVQRGRALAATGKREAANGHEIVEILQAELRETRLRNGWQPEPVPLETAQVLAGMVRPKSIRGDLIEHALECVRRDRRVAAGLAFAELRQSFTRDRDWVTFVEERLAPFKLAIERLIGQVVHRKAIASCAKCGTGVTCPCTCGAPYVPEVPWVEDEPALDEAAPTPEPSALERAQAAILAHPDWSNPLIAKEAGVGQETARRARQQMEVDGEVGGEVARIGADGRRRRLPGQTEPVTAPPPGRSNPHRDLIQEAAPDAVTIAQRWSWSFGHVAGDAIAMAAFWSREFGDQWKKLRIEPEHIALAQQAAEAWEAIAEDLIRRKA